MTRLVATFETGAALLCRGSHGEWRRVADAVVSVTACLATHILGGILSSVLCLGQLVWVAELLIGMLTLCSVTLRASQLYNVVAP